MSAQKEHDIVGAVRQLLIAVAGLPPNAATAAVKRAADHLRDKLGVVGYDLR